MSDKDNFTSGLITGAILGGIVGGILGTVITAKRQTKNKNGSDLFLDDENFNLDTEEKIESARRTLENKIAQLNLAIDDVTEQLGVNESLEATEADQEI
jgi:Na+/glutamate symporter